MTPPASFLAFGARVRRVVGRLRQRAGMPRAPRLAPADVWIIVLNWNRKDDTLECLASLAEADLGGATVCVVDNGSTDGSADAIRARFPHVRLVVLPRNEGYAGGNNAGVRVALAEGAKGVLLLNNDTKVAADFLWPLLKVLEDYPRCGAVASAILRYDSPEVLDTAYLQIFFGHGLVRRRGMNALPGEGYDLVVPIDAGIGCSLLIARDALERVGLLDEDYFAYHEEVDWCWRARLNGLVVFYQPYSRVYHHGSRSTNAEKRPRRRDPNRPELPNAIPLTWSPIRTYLGSRNEVRFLKKHANPFQFAAYWLSSLYHLPLEYLAALMNREEDIWLGLWSYRRALWLYCREGDGTDPARVGTKESALRTLARAPRALCRDLPRDLRAARADGVTVQVDTYCRGLWDGLRNRPLPLEQLGLR